MKKLLSYLIFLFASEALSQNTVLSRIDPANSNNVQIKWYCPKLINSAGCHIYRRESSSMNWKRLNKNAVLFRSYEVSNEELKQDKELKSYLELASNPENIKELALLAVLIKSFKSDAFANYLGIRYDDSTVQPGKEYEYKVTVITSSEETELGISKKIRVTNYSPIAPPQTITTKNGNKKVSFKWSPEPNSYFGVNIYRKTNDTGVYRKITKDLVILSKTKNKKGEEVYGDEFYVDSKLKPHTDYYYQLEALDFFGTPSTLSNPILISLKDLDAPKSPDSVYNTLNGKSVFVKWKKKNKEEDLSGFNVYRTTKNDSDFIKVNKEIISVKDTVFKDQAPHFGSYMYKVSCIDKDSNETISNPFHVEVYDNEPPARPENITIQADSGRLILSWNKNKEDDLKGYFIYRTINKNAEDTYVKVTPDPLTTNTYTDVLSKNIKNKFLYKVVAIDKSLNRSSYSEFAIAGMPDVVAPNAPFLKTIFLNEKKQILIEWFPNAEPDLAGYSIYRKNLTDSSSYKKLNTKLLDRSRFRYTDRYAEETATYEYYIEAIDSSSNISKSSNHLRFKLKNKDEEDQLKITDFKVDYRAKQNQVILKWSLKNESNIKGCILYKLKSGDASFSAMTGNLEELTFSDKDILPGENYTYQLRVYDQNGDVYRSEKISLTIK